MQGKWVLARRRLKSMDDEKKTKEKPQNVNALWGHVAKPKHGECNLKSRSTSTKNRGERIRSALENLPVMLNAFDVRGNIIVWNRECERVTGYAATEIIANQSMTKILYPHIARNMQQNNRGDTYYHWTCDMTCKDGSIKRVSWFDLSEQFPIPGWATWRIGFDTTDQEGTKKAPSMLGMEIDDLRVKEAAEEVRQMWGAEIGRAHV